MRSPYGILIAAWLLIFACLGCSGAKNNIKEIPSSLNVLSPDKAYNRNVALLLAYTPPTDVGRQIGDRFFEKLVSTIADEDERLHLMTSKSSGFPSYFMSLAQQEPTADDHLAAVASARASGWNHWGIVRIEGLRHVARQTGFLWFAKLRHFVFFELHLALYDSVTGAKVIDEVIESSAKIEDDQYQAVESGAAGDYEALNEEIDDIGERLGEKVAETLAELPWRTPVLKVENGLIVLQAGTGSGLGVGDRLSVFEGRRILEGQDKEQFHLPGFLIAQIEITQVTDRSATAKTLETSSAVAVQPGDFAASVE